MVLVKHTVNVRLMMWKFLALPVNLFLMAATASFGLCAKKENNRMVTLPLPIFKRINGVTDLKV